MMNPRTLLSLPLALFLVTACSTNAQNARPSVANVRTTVSSDGKQLTVQYDLSDPEDTQIETSLQLLNAEGRAVTLSASGLSGDVGFPVTPGTGRQIIWQYDAMVDAMLGTGPLRARVVADDRQTVAVQPVVDAVDSSRLRSDLTSIVGVRHHSAAPAKLDLTRAMLATHFEVHGLTTYEQQFDYNGYAAGNVIGDLPGVEHPDSVIILGAHFDSVEDAPGADDNGSGTVGMMEAIRALSTMQFAKTIRFIAFDQEEMGLEGSEAYVNRGRQLGEIIEGMIDFEMIGYYSDEPNSQQVPVGFNLLFPEQHNAIASNQFRGDFITNVANEQSTALMMAFENAAEMYVPSLRVISTAVPGNGEIAPDFRRSDHAVFWEAGIPAIMLTDGANFRNPNYHTPGDSLGTIDFAFMQNVVKATVATMMEIGGVRHAGAGTSEAFTVGTSSVRDQFRSSNGVSMLEQNTPNPFSASTTIGITLPRQSHATLKVFDLLGRDVATLIDDVTSAGSFSLTFDREEHGLPAGAYIYRLVVDGVAQARMMVAR